MEEQDLLGRFIFQKQLGKAIYDYNEKNRTKTHFSKKVNLNKCTFNHINGII